MNKRHCAIAILFLLLSYGSMAEQASAPAPVPMTANGAVSAPKSPAASDPQFGSRRNQERDPIEDRMEKDRLKALNKERHDSLKKDTDLLLKLATELKQSVDKSTKDTLSLEVIRKTEEVEKLAKQVREKMKQY